MLDQEAPFLKQVNACIATQMDNSELLIRDIAAEFNMSERSFHRKLMALIGVSLKQHVIKQRRNSACKLLLQSDKTIVRIALACGFRSSAQFSRAFTHHHKMTPKEYRDQPKNSQS